MLAWLNATPAAKSVDSSRSTPGSSASCGVRSPCRRRDTRVGGQWAIDSSGSQLTEVQAGADDAPVYGEDHALAVRRLAQTGPGVRALKMPAVPHDGLPSLPGST